MTREVRREVRLLGALVGATVAAALLVLASRACAVDGGAAPAPPPPPPEGENAAPSKSCLAGLRARGVEFAEQPTKGVRTPVRLLGTNLGPLRLVPRERRAGGLMPVMDCELARALLEGAPLFQLAGIRDLYFSGIYQYRTRRGTSRLSEHAHGLAIDVHQFGTADGRVYDVERDFQAGAGDWASKEQATCVGSPGRPEARALRELACGLRASSAFREVITADDNADHENHFHLEAFPDPLTRARAILNHREPTTDD